MKFRYVGVSSSNRKDKTTSNLVAHTLECAKQRTLELLPDAEVETVLVSLAQKSIKPCCDCGGCLRKGTLCLLKDDWLSCMEPILEPCPPDGLVLGSPVYFHSTNSLMRAFMERWTCLFKKVWHPEHPVPAPDFSRTAAGAVAVGADRNGGVEEAISNIISFLCTCGFVTVGSFDLRNGPVGYTGGAAWSKAPGVKELGIEADACGMLAAETVGRRIGETAVVLRTGQPEKAY